MPANTDLVTTFCRAVWRHEQATIDALANRVGPNAADRWGHTPLLMAAEYGDLALVTQLVRRGAAVDQQRTYLTPITAAARRGAADIVAFLRDAGATISVVTAIHLGEHATVRRALVRDPALASARDEMGTPLLLHAADALRPEMVELLLEHGANIAEVDATGETALHRVADRRQASPEAARATTALLLDRGADPNARNRDDVTPLHQAVRARNLAVAEVLLARGADANARDRVRGSTPLRRAISTTGAGGTAGTAALMLPLATLLLAHGADPDARDKRGVPVYASARSPAVRALLAAHRRGDRSTGGRT